MDLSDYVDKNDMKDLVDSFLKELESRDNKVFNIIKDRGKLIFSNLYKDLLKHGSVDGEDLLYFESDYLVNDSDFHVLFDSMFDYVKDCNMFYDDSISFSHGICYYKYGDNVIKLFHMVGQGSAEVFTLCDSSSLLDLDSSLFVDIEDFFDFYQS